MSLIDALIEFRELRIFANSDPSDLNEFAAQARIADAGDAAASNGIAGGIFARGETDERADLFGPSEKCWITDAREQMAGGDPAQTGHALNEFDRSEKFTLLLAEAADFFLKLHCLLMGVFQMVEELIELEAQSGSTG